MTGPGATLAPGVSGWRLAPTAQVFGVILNDRASLALYGAKMEQPPHVKPPRAPVLYLKTANTHAAHGAVVMLPAGAGEVEVGATLGIVFGRTASRETAASALSAVAGYTIAIDLSLPKADLYRPAIVEKCWDGSCPVGPRLATAIADPDALSIAIGINDVVWHERSTADLVRPVATLIADVTEFMSLYAGDVLLVGYPLDVPRAVAGDLIAATITGIGRLECRLAGGAR